MRQERLRPFGSLHAYGCTVTSFILPNPHYKIYSPTKGDLVWFQSTGILTMHFSGCDESSV